MMIVPILAMIVLIAILLGAAVYNQIQIDALREDLNRLEKLTMGMRNGDNT